MRQTSMLHVRIDDDLKAEGNAVLEAIGLTAADAVRLFYKRIVAEQAVPLELKVPNAATQAAMKESRAILRARSARFAKAEDLIGNLETAGRK
jgi:DNA-damage-inducible protein J